MQLDLCTQDFHAFPQDSGENKACLHCTLGAPFHRTLGSPPPTGASPSAHRVVPPSLSASSPGRAHGPPGQQLPSCAGHSAPTAKPHCLHCTDVDTEAWRQQGTCQGPTDSGWYSILDSRPDLVTPPAGLLCPLTAYLSCHLQTGLWQQVRGKPMGTGC